MKVYTSIENLIDVSEGLKALAEMLEASYHRTREKLEEDYRQAQEGLKAIRAQLGTIRDNIANKQQEFAKAVEEKEAYDEAMKKIAEYEASKGSDEEGEVPPPPPPPPPPNPTPDQIQSELNILKNEESKCVDLEQRMIAEGRRFKEKMDAMVKRFETCTSGGSGGGGGSSSGQQLANSQKRLADLKRHIASFLKTIINTSAILFAGFPSGSNAVMLAGQTENLNNCVDFLVDNAGVFRAMGEDALRRIGFTRRNIN